VFNPNGRMAYELGNALAEPAPATNTSKTGSVETPLPAAARAAMQNWKSKRNLTIGESLAEPAPDADASKKGSVAQSTETPHAAAATVQKSRRSMTNGESPAKGSSAPGRLINPQARSPMRELLSRHRFRKSCFDLLLVVSFWPGPGASISVYFSQRG
jgi:hypothetical protein